MSYTGARILVETLIENGVDTIFGYPGGAVLNIYDELYKYKDKIRHILVSHEQHAVHAADGYARSTGRAGVCLATSGPGATNLVTGIAAAFSDSVPVIAITGNAGIPLLGKDSFQEVDITGITMPIVKHNWIVEDVNDLAQIVREAFIVALSGRPGPVLIDIPKDISFALCAEQGKMEEGRALAATKDLYFNEREKRLIDRTKRETFNDDDINRAAALIKSAKRPLLYVGGGAVNSGADSEVKILAELLDAPVALSLMGMGAFPSGHRLCTGLIGMHGTIASNKAVQKADLLIALGARFSDRVTGGLEHFAKKARIIHIDIDPAEINKNISADEFIIGDLKKILNKLVKKLPKNFINEWNSDIDNWKDEEKKRKRKKKKEHTVKRTSIEKEILNPEFIIIETAKVLGDKTIVVTDVGQHQIWTAQYFPFKNPRSFLSSGGMGAMGYGMGAAVGAKIAKSSSPVVLFTGDGSFRMDSAEMATLVKYALPVLIIVFNNQTLGMLRQWQNIFYNANYYETGLDNRGPDFIKLAQAYDVPAFRVTEKEAFLDALGKGINFLAEKKPVLIEVIIDKDERVVPIVPSGKPLDEQIM